MIYDDDIYLEPYKEEIVRRYRKLISRRDEIAGCGGKLSDAVNNHLYYGVHKENGSWVFREYAPGAVAIYVIGDFNDWKISGEFRMESAGNGDWELRVPADAVRHGDLFKWFVRWDGGEGERIPAYATRCIQDPQTKLFAAQIWDPPVPYRWKCDFREKIENPLIYEVHIGMAGEKEGISGFKDFSENVLPQIARLGYNTIQIMALQEHPYYGSFGYQVSGFFALSSRFGTPEEFKEIVDTAHSMGIAVVMDMVHSHAVRNEAEGIGRIDGTDYLYFHSSSRGDHPAWGTRCFDYGKDSALYFLLSNCKYWMEEYHLDGIRFDGVTSMLYYDHGLGRDFTGYENYFDGREDTDAMVYLGLANLLVKELKPQAFTIAEDMSGMPGLAAPVESGGFGFDYRMSMGVPDAWIRWIKELPDEKWSMGDMYYRLTDKRADERTISYAESHDQALVGDKTIIFRLMDKEMYEKMNLGSESLLIDRGIALHKMIRLVTIGTAGDGYLTFMGNEFGHPEWIDFPREGNGWSYKYARRQWSLRDNPFLRYGRLWNFDREMISLFKKEKILQGKPVSVFNDEEKQIMIFERFGFFFVFNFSPVNSYRDYRFPAPAGAYRTVLDTDWKEFDGFERNERDLRHFTLYENGGNYLSLYLPSRTAVVLRESDGKL